MASTFVPRNAAPSSLSKQPDANLAGVKDQKAKAYYGSHLSKGPQISSSLKGLKIAAQTQKKA